MTIEDEFALMVILEVHMDLKHTRLTLSLISGTVLLTACAGAVISGAGGAYKGNESQEAVVKKCLVSRGYKVLN
ncbi:MAG: hypothetical protein ACOVMU_04685 [Polynucleobacter sp.]